MGGTHLTKSVIGGKKSFSQESVLCFYHVGPGAQTQVCRFGSMLCLPACYLYLHVVFTWEPFANLISSFVQEDHKPVFLINMHSIVE